MNYKAYFFDFDGVILNSNALKIQGFIDLFSGHPEHLIQEYVTYHRATEGISRFVKIRYFYEKLLGQPITEDQVQAHAQRFSEIMLGLVLNPQLIILETLDFIRSLQGKADLHIISGTEEKELNIICNHLNLSQYFGQIKGSPLTKPVHFRQLFETYGYSPEQVVMIGDSQMDLDASLETGCDFWGYNNLELVGKGNGYIRQLSPALVLDHAPSPH